ncbi:hypothetical protein E2C01_026509 [Portunus trituberculatus]|uniref:Uncharacterized protein n=1 Tax=Portunus trituberculatus TaxID=210409 RepID=A0A5B7EIZ0_PORTR|nr:hypothetical protein [Portunus trituberculatus]
MWENRAMALQEYAQMHRHNFNSSHMQQDTKEISSTLRLYLRRWGEQESHKKKSYKDIFVNDDSSSSDLPLLSLFSPILLSYPSPAFTYGFLVLRRLTTDWCCASLSSIRWSLLVVLHC